MGWYGESNEICPKCNGKNAATQFHNNMQGPLILWCPDCGLTMYCEEVQFKIHTTFIDENIIGKNLEEVDLDIRDYDFDKIKNDNILKETTYKASYQ